MAGCVPVTGRTPPPGTAPAPRGDFLMLMPVQQSLAKAEVPASARPGRRMRSQFRPPLVTSASRLQPQGGTWPCHTGGSREAVTLAAGAAVAPTSQRCCRRKRLTHVMELQPRPQHLAGQESCTPATAALLPRKWQAAAHAWGGHGGVGTAQPPPAEPRGSHRRLSWHPC